MPLKDDDYIVRRNAAAFPDIAFTLQSSLKGAQAFYNNVKSRCDRYGHSPDDMLVLPGALLFIGETESEAQEKYDMLNSLIPLRVAMQRLSANLGGIDLSKFELDAPLPDIPVNDMRVSAVHVWPELR